MNEKTKAIAIIVAAIAICMLVYSPLTLATQTELNFEDEVATTEIEEYNPKSFKVRPRARFATWFLKNAQPNEVEGTVVALLQKKLVINVEERQIRINMPRQWTTESESLTLNELYEKHLDGQEVVIKVLEADLIDREGLLINILVGYEISTDSGIKATACLKVNIET
jgi:hypothetical protein